MKLKTIICSTRPSRQGPAVARWFHEAAQSHGGFEAELVDLVDVGLPVFDEPAHPKLKQYVHEHTKRWSAIVEDADAFVFVTPEYDYSPPPSLSNALVYLLSEWAYKPAGFVSYGGISGGLRGVQVLRQTLYALKVVPMVESVVVPMFSQYINDSGVFEAAPIHQDSANTMLTELARWTEAMALLRK